MTPSGMKDSNASYSAAYRQPVDQLTKLGVPSFQSWARPAFRDTLEWEAYIKVLTRSEQVVNIGEHRRGYVLTQVV